MTNIVDDSSCGSICFYDGSLVELRFKDQIISDGSFVRWSLVRCIGDTSPLMSGYSSDIDGCDLICTAEFELNLSSDLAAHLCYTITSPDSCTAISKRKQVVIFACPTGSCVSASILPEEKILCFNQRALCLGGNALGINNL